MKNIRKSIFFSMLSIVLCIAMLIGTTFAWFTDSASSGMNRIVAGNLDVEVEYAVPGENGMLGNFQPMTKNTNSLFSSSLWEPGHTEYVTLKVVNKGTLAFNYQMVVSPVTESGGINMQGNSFKLSDYLVFSTTQASNDVQTFETRDAARAAAGTGTKLNQSTLAKTGMLYAANDVPQNGSSVQYVTLVVYMPETVGNEANYKTGTTPPTIDLGITVLATQLRYEYDSFNNQYDGDNTVQTNSVEFVPQVSQSVQINKNGADVTKDAQDNNAELDGSNNLTIKSSVKVSEVTGASGDSSKEFANVIVPAAKINSLEDGDHTIVLNVDKDDAANAAFTAADEDEGLASGVREKTTYEVNVTLDGIPITTAENNIFYMVKLFVGANRINLVMYHHADKMTELDAGTAFSANNQYKYDSDSGYVTMYVTNFSPFTAVYDHPVAAIGTTVYYSLSDALDAWQADVGDTITLLDDCEYDSKITVDKDLTLNLNGKNLVFPQMKNAITVNAGKTLTINDSTNIGKIESNGTAASDSTSYNSTIYLIKGTSATNRGGKLVLNGGEIKSNGNYSNSTTICCGFYADVDINGGKVTLNLPDSMSGNVIKGGSYTTNVTIDNAIITNISNNPSSNILYNGPTGTINNSIINGYIATGDNLSMANCTINGNLGTTTSAGKNIIIENCIINGDFRYSTYGYQYGKLINCTVEGNVYSSAACVSGGKYKNKFDILWLEEGKTFSSEPDADGYYTVRDVTQDECVATLMYDGLESPLYFRSITDAINAGKTAEHKATAVVTVIKDCAAGSLSPYSVNKVVVAQGVTLTLSSGITLTSSSVSSARCTFENNGTVISSGSISGSVGQGYLVNNGTITAKNIGADTAGWVNNGTIITTSAGNSITASFTNNGTIQGNSGDVTLFVKSDSTMSGTGTLYTEGRYVWDTEQGKFVPDGPVYNENRKIYYSTIKDAFAGANVGDTVVLYADFKTASATASKKVTLDLNGHTVSYGNSQNSGTIVVANGGDLTVKDRTATTAPILNNDGTVTYTSGKIEASFGVAGVMVKSGGKLTVESGTIQANSDNVAIGLYEHYKPSSTNPKPGVSDTVVNITGGLVINTNTKTDRYGDAIHIFGTNYGDTKTAYSANDPTLNISGGIVYAKRGSAIMGQGTLNNTKINISGGTVYSDATCAIYHPQYGEMTVSGDALVKGPSAICFKGGDLTISGGTIVATLTGTYSAPKAPIDSGTNITGDALYIEDSYNRGITVNITGGTFTTAGTGMQEYRVLFSGNTPAVVTDSRSN